MRATFVALTMRLALIAASIAFGLSALTLSSSVLPNVIGAGLMGATIGATLWAICVLFDLAVLSLKALPLLALHVRPLLLGRNRPQ
jgi:hypothetical protein